MTRLEKVIDIVADNLAISSRETITAEHKIGDDLGADSLDIVEIIMFIEEEFDVTIPDDESSEFITIGDIADWLDNQVD